MVLGLPLRLLAPTGLHRSLINRQRLIHTFVTDLRGPGRAAIGTLRITVWSDPGRVPDVAVLTAALRRDLGSAVQTDCRLGAGRVSPGDGQEGDQNGLFDAAGASSP